MRCPGCNTENPMDEADVSEELADATREDGLDELNAGVADPREPEGAKFCIQCASPLKRPCRKCGFENPPEARFCAQCAASLTGNEALRR